MNVLKAVSLIATSTLPSVWAEECSHRCESSFLGCCSQNPGWYPTCRELLEGGELDQFGCVSNCTDTAFMSDALAAGRPACLNCNFFPPNGKPISCSSSQCVETCPTPPDCCDAEGSCTNAAMQECPGGFDLFCKTSWDGQCLEQAKERCHLNCDAPSLFGFVNAYQLGAATAGWASQSNSDMQEWSQTMLDNYIGYQTGPVGALAFLTTVGDDDTPPLMKVLTPESASSNFLWDWETVFEIGSISKSFTTLLTAILIEEEVMPGFTWDSTLAEMFPDQASCMLEPLATITMFELASDTSGLPRWPPNFPLPTAENPIPDNFYNASSLLEAVCKLIPGTKGNMKDSNFALGLLGYIDVLVGQAKHPNADFTDLVKEYISGPLDMPSIKAASRMDENEKLRMPPPTMIGVDSGLHLILTEALVGAGGLVSNMQDMLKFANFLILKGGPYPASLVTARDVVLTPVATDDYDPQRRSFVGLGFDAFYQRGDVMWWKDGATFGFGASIVFNHASAMVILANARAMSYTTFLPAVANTALAGPPLNYDGPSTPFKDIDPAIFGTYVSPDARIFIGDLTITPAADPFSLTMRGFSRSVQFGRMPYDVLTSLKSSDGSLFYAPNVPLEVEFITESDGSEYMVLLLAGQDLFIPKGTPQSRDSQEEYFDFGLWVAERGFGGYTNQ